MMAMSQGAPPCYFCRHFRNYASDQDYESYPICEAFPEIPGIPDEIFMWEKPHLKSIPGQIGDAVYKPRPGGLTGKDLKAKPPFDPEGPQLFRIF